MFAVLKRWTASQNGTHIKRELLDYETQSADLRERLTRAQISYNDAVPPCFRAPFVIGVLPRALCGDGQHGELRTVTFRLTLLRVRTNKPDESFRVSTWNASFFCPIFRGTQKRRLLLPRQAAALWEGTQRLCDLNHRLAISEASVGRKKSCGHLNLKLRLGSVRDYPVSPSCA
jgi:hypothetical protein